MIRVSYEAIENAAQKMGRVSADLGCGTPLAEISGAADETAVAGALDALANAWTQTLQQHSRQAAQMGTALNAAARCYFFAEQSTTSLFSSKSS